MCLSLRSSLTVILPLLCLFVISVGFSMSKKSPFRSRAFLDALKVPLLSQGGAVTPPHTCMPWAGSFISIDVFFVSIFELFNSWNMNCDIWLGHSCWVIDSQRALPAWSRSRIKVLPLFPFSECLPLLPFLLRAIIQTPSFTRKRTLTVDHLLNCGKASCAVFQVCFREWNSPVKAGLEAESTMSWISLKTALLFFFFF